MLVNGRGGAACAALVDRLLAEQPDEIELRPMEKLPASCASLVVNRRRLFRALEKVRGLGFRSTVTTTWGPGRVSPEQQQQGPIRCRSA